MKILVVEDDKLNVYALTAVLTNQNYAVEVAVDGDTAWDLIQTYDYDLILLDVMLPKLNGISLCRQIRSSGRQMPILLLTGCDSSHEKAIGLDAGADDYVVKPFDQEELVARVRALLRRGKTTAQPILEWGNLQLDPSSCEVTYNQHLLSLTPKEYALLELFLRNSRRVFSCSMILEHIWSYEDTPGEEAVRTHIKGLRMKLRNIGAPHDLIETVYGIGYRLKSQEAGEPGSKEEVKNSPSTPKSKSHQQQTLAAIAGIWQKFYGRIDEQVKVLEQVAIALSSEALNPDLYVQARQEAHTLAGSLGTFGLPEGSRLARKIEQLLKSEKKFTSVDINNLQNWVKSLRQEIVSQQPEALSPPSNVKQQLPLVLVVDTDVILVEQLATASAEGKFIITHAHSLKEARNILYQQHPHLVLLDPSVTSHQEDSLRFLADLAQYKPPLPVVIFTEQTDFQHRLQLARQGGHTFLPKPMNTSEIIEAIAQILQQTTHAEAKVLAVDDDPQILALLQILLHPWGLQVITLKDPRQFWETLADVKPDLLILDVEMPHTNGIEICQVVRNDPQWSELPILFLTVHSDAEIVNQVFSVGADDFVSKPIVGPELVTRIINRLERMKLLHRVHNSPRAALSESEASYQQLIELCPEAIFIQSEEHFVFLNSAAIQLFGATKAEEILGKKVLDLVHPNSQRQVQERIEYLREFKQPVPLLEEEFIRLNQEVITLEVVAAPCSYQGKTAAIVVARDISHRKQIEAALQQVNNELELRVAERTAELVNVNQKLQSELDERLRIEEALRISQVRLARILDIADDAIISIDGNQRITLFNQGAEKIFGYSAQEIMGECLDVLIPKRFSQVHHQHVQDFGQAPNLARRMGERREIFGRRQDGTEFPAEASISKLYLNEEVFYTVILRDITERKQIDRMKDEFVSVVSHELRTPLTSIHGSLGMLTSGLLAADSTSGKRLLQIATDSTERLVRLINDILDIERIESGRVKMEREICNLDDLVASAVSIIQPLANKAGVKLSISSLSIQLWVDPDRIVQTFTNLLSNAIKFSDAGNTVWLIVEKHDDELLVTVKDQGRGIPSDKINSVFERFQQVDSSDSRNHEGTGLGLAICQSIVQQHGGRIWAESVLGEGSSFYLTFPIMSLPQNSELADADSAHTPLVLVCDDDPVIRIELQTLLEKGGYRVVTVASGQEAIATASIQHPDVIILDLLMPEINGWETMAMLKERSETKDIPIVICSVYQQTSSSQTNGDFVDWLSKPVQESNLLHSLRQAIAASSRRVRILIVEDDPNLAEVLINLLEKYEIETFLAQTGGEAIRLSQTVNPDLLILDLILPETDGFAVIDWLQKHNRLCNVPVVVYSAMDLDESERQRLKLGHTEFLTKGRVTTQEFEQRVIELLQRITQTSSVK